MKLILNCLMLTASFFPVVSFGFDVKGLELGQVTSQQELANLFGNADCSIDIEKIKLFGASCTVPISYLGIKTSAYVKMDQQWIVKHIEIKIPYELLPQVETYLTKQYGKPDVVRGTKKILTDLRRADGALMPPTTTSERCSQWRSIEHADIGLCDSGLFSRPSSRDSSVTFYYKIPKILDESDT